MPENDNDTLENDKKDFGKTIAHYKNIASANLDSLKDFFKEYKAAFIIGALCFLFVIILIFLFVAFVKPMVFEQSSTDYTISKMKDIFSETKEVSSAQHIDESIQKANILFERGLKEEATNMLKNVSDFSYSLSKFNLGVMQLKSKNYKAALDLFEESIKINEDVSINALNAAISAYHLKDMKLFGHYIDIAEKNLFKYTNTPLYSYVYALINYYKGFYLEAIPPLIFPKHKTYPRVQDHILARIYALYGDNKASIKYLQKSQYINDSLSLGLLHSRIGDYYVAKQYLTQSIKTSDDIDKKAKSYMAAALVDLKQNQFGSAASLLKEGSQIKNFTKFYPIKVGISEEFYDVTLAQKHFSNDLLTKSLSSKRDLATLYRILFYYSPYRVFYASDGRYITNKYKLVFFVDAKNSLNMLREAPKGSLVDASLHETLLKIVLNKDIRGSIKAFEKNLKYYPNHSTLHYNLGISYANLGDFTKAYYHFVKSFTQNDKDILSGVFAIMSSNVVNKDASFIKASILSSLETIQDKETKEFYGALLNFISGNALATTNWLDSKKTDDSPINLALETLLSLGAKDSKRLKRATLHLYKKFPRDTITNIILGLANNFNAHIKDISLNMQYIYTDEANLDMTSVLYGPTIAKDLYVKFAYMIGKIYYAKKLFEDKLLVSNNKPIGPMSALAYAHMFSREFEESFVLYNKLIDDYKQKDSDTLFFAASAAIGAGYHSNAIALLELAKLTNPSDLESRIALGLLYQEARNLESAIIQYSFLGNMPFKSIFFDFELVH